MQKKLLAVAVAGALGAPAVAMAQSSTVQVFGTMYIEYSLVDQGRYPAAAFPGGTQERSRADYIQTPGSEIGFKGEEKLGGGLSAWFQCTSTADPRGISGDGFCERNSALGMKGGFGNVFIGNWDTPFKRTISPTNVGGNDTGTFGTAFLLTGGSTTTAYPGQAAGSGASVGRAIFKRRQNNLITYDSPNFGGFQVMAAVTSAQASTGTFEGTTNQKARIMSVAAQYSAGPIYVAAGYEVHKDANGNTAAPPVAGTAREGDDKGWHVGAAYTWGPVKFGGQFTSQKVESGSIAVPTDVKYRAWHVGVDWNIVGPHGMRAAYTRALDTHGTPGAAANAGNGVTRPGVAVAGASNDNGAKLMQIRYVYTFSKRTEFNVGYVRLDNDNVGTYNLGGLGSLPVAGENQSAWVMSLRHTF
ncbi:MAG TPA: porin [Burkholderiales bacterium]|nr:porin [Burkholderiales bacterium]